MKKTSRQSTRYPKMHTEEHALKKKLPFTTFFRSARAAFIGIQLFFCRHRTDCLLVSCLVYQVLTLLNCVWYFDMSLPSHQRLWLHVSGLVAALFNANVLKVPYTCSFLVFFYHFWLVKRQNNYLKHRSCTALYCQQCQQKDIFSAFCQQKKNPLLLRTLIAIHI